MPALDDFAGIPTQDFPATHAAAVTPSDTADLAHVSRALWVGGSGNVEVIMMGGEDVTYVGVLAGTLLPYRVSRVKASLTTATFIVAVW